MITIHSWSVSGFMSIRDEIKVGVTDAKITAYVGPNGSGKSSLVSDALVWILTGETTKDTRADAVINRKIGNNCVGALMFTKDREMYNVHRCRKHSPHKASDLRIQHNGKWMKHEHVKAAQAALYKLLDCQDAESVMSQLVFGQRMFARFSMATAAEQTAILEDHLKLSTLPLAKTLTGEKLRSIEDRISLHAREVERLKDIWEQDRMRLARGVSQKRADISALKTQLNDADLTRRNALDDMKRGEQFLAQAEKEREKTAEAHREAYRILKALKDTAETSVCATCGQSLPKLPIKRAKKKLVEAQKRLHEASDVDLAAAKKVKERTEKAVAWSEAYSKAEAQIQTLTALLGALEKDTDGLEELDKRVSDAHERMRYEQAQVDSLERLQAHYAFWRKGFGPQGVRADALAAATVALSQEVNRWYAKLGDTRKVNLVWDDLGRLEINVGRLRFENLSHGEKQRLDVAIMLSLMQLTVQGTGFNLRVFDDPFSGVDAAGCQAMLDAWRELPGTSFVLVPELQSEWADRIDHTHRVQKTAHGTRIE